MRADIDARMAQVDEALDDNAERWGVWEELGPYGGWVRLHVNGRHLAKVLRARASHPLLRPTRNAL